MTIFNVIAFSDRKLWYETLAVQVNGLNDSVRDTQGQQTGSSFCRLHLTMNDMEIYDSHNVSDFVQLMLKSTPITDLHIAPWCFSMPILMIYLALLPSLTSLSISAQSPEIYKDLSEEYLKRIDQCASNHRITKLNLEVMTEMDQIHFLLHLCPKITHLQVTCRSMTDMEWLVGYVSLQQKMKLVPDLRCLCLRKPQAGEQMVETLQALIQERKLFDNFIIRRIYDRIVITW